MAGTDESRDFDVVHASHLAASTATGTDLPADYLDAASRRLVAALLLTAAIHVLYFVLYNTVWVADAHALGRGIAIGMTVLTVGLALFLRRRSPDRMVIVRSAVAYHFALGFTVALTEYWDMRVLDEAVRTISWNCVNILLLPLLVPTAPRNILWIGLGLSILNPAAYLLLTPFQGTPVTEPAMLVSMFLPPVLCAFIAYVPSGVLYGLQRELREARQLGAYELVDKLGDGGMGEVWSARHRLLVRPAAIKLIKANLMAGTGADVQRLIARFEREAQATATLESPHTIDLYDFGVADDGTFYCVMELLTGVDLDTLVKEHGPLPPARVVRLLRQACDSLEDAHRRGLIHRDVKPANMFLSRRARRYDYVKVLDFGLVKHERLPESAEVIGVTMDGSIQGTPAYLAPESIVGDGEVDARVDVYALGCVAYYLLTGRLVFEGESPMKVAISHVKDRPEPPSTRVIGGVPESLEAVVLACLAKSPSDRPVSARAVADMLAACDLPDSWDDEAAAAWWRENLPDLA